MVAMEILLVLVKAAWNVIINAMVAIVVVIMAVQIVQVVQVALIAQVVHVMLVLLLAKLVMEFVMVVIAIIVLAAIVVINAQPVKLAMHNVTQIISNILNNYHHQLGSYQQERL